MKSFDHGFIVGKVYNRKRDIHGNFSGQERSGIVTPAAAPLIFAFTSEAGAAYGYEDTFKPDGSFWYTGEGQVGDMQMIRGNSAISNQAKTGRAILLFGSAPKDQVRFLGEVEYLGHHVEQRPDRDGHLRNAIIFHLGFLPPSTKIPAAADAVAEPKKVYAHLGRFPSKLTLEELRELALEKRPNDSPIEVRRAYLARRAEAIKIYALRRAAGKCESCTEIAPFNSKSGPFLEVHHVFRLSDGGPDHPANVIALCPNCHRRAHYSVDAVQFNDGLVSWLSQREPA